MSLESNKQIVRDHFALMAQGRYIEALKDFADDATWWVVGHGAHGGAHPMSDLIAAYEGPVPGYFPEGIVTTIDLLVAEGDWVMCEGRGQAPTPTGIGREYQNQYVWLFEIRDGKVRTFKEYFDTLHAEERIFGKRLVEG